MRREGKNMGSWSPGEGNILRKIISVSGASDK